MEITINEKLELNDFLEANFPHVLKPFYTRRLFIINMAFGLLFTVATVYLYFQSFKNHIHFEMAHYLYLFFAVLFTFLAVYLLKREKKIYRNLINEINSLNTVYTIADNNIKVKNTKVDLKYDLKDLKNFIELHKWIVFEFNNGERLSIYKPNIAPEDLEKLIRKFKTN